MVKWKCNDCLETIKKLPKRTIHNFTKAQRSKSRQPVQKLFRQTLKDALLNTKIVIGNESSTSGSNDYTKAVFHLQDKGFSASFDLCPKVNIVGTVTNTCTLTHNLNFGRLSRILQLGPHYILNQML